VIFNRFCFSDNASIPFVKQLYLKGQIEQPIVSVLLSRHLVTFGGLDDLACLIDQRIQVPSVSEYDWMVEAEDFEITHLGKVGKIRVSLANLCFKLSQLIVSRRARHLYSWSSHILRKLIDQKKHNNPIE
jgi:hypothetical protein